MYFFIFQFYFHRTFEEFAAWWRREEVLYVLKRSNPILPLQIKCVHI